MCCIKLVQSSHRHNRVFFCDSIAVKINVNDLYTTGKPYVRKTCHIHPRGYSSIKNGGALFENSKGTPKKELESGLVGVAPIHLSLIREVPKKSFE